MTGNALRTQVCGGTAVTHNTGVDAVLTGDQGCSGGKTGGIGAVILIKSHAFRGNAVDVWRGVPAVTVTAHVVVSEGIDVEDNNTHDKSPFSLPEEVFMVY